MEKIGKIMAAFLVIFFMALSIAGSWAITAGLLYLVCLLFGWTFKLSIATGVWLLMIIAKAALS